MISFPEFSTLKSYPSFLIKQIRPVGFGFALTFASSFGQTFLLSLYVPHILRSLSLSPSVFGGLYSAATLSSAFLLLRFGKRVDKRPLIPYTTAAISLLSLSCFLLALTFHPFMLFPALLGLRFAGQGLMTNISQTVMSRHFERSRGKALSISSLGFSFGELVLPILIGILLLKTGWRFSLLISSSLALTLILLLLKILPIGSFETVQPTDMTSETGGNPPQNMILPEKTPHFFSEMACNPLFWEIAPVVGVLSMVTTGFFFYQMVLVEQRHWLPEWYALVFSTYALTRFISAISIGPLVDRFGARLLFPFHMIPLTGGLILMGFASSKLFVYIFLIATGITMGTSSILKSAVYADLFGTRQIGAVRSLFSSVMVFGTALGPVVFGVFLDAGFSMERILLCCSLLTGACVINSFRIWQRRPVVLTTA